MQEKKHKKFKKIYLVYICIILVLIYCIIQIYAVFQSEVEGTINFTNGVWKIRVNNTDISKGVNKTFTVGEIEVKNNDHIKQGNLAPGSVGTFDISIDPEGTDVSVRYDVSLNQENLTNKNITIKSITETAEGENLTKTAENTYTGIIPLEKIKQGVENNIKVEIEWKDDETNNEQDLETGSQSENYKLEIPVVVHVSQYLGEEIVAYEGN